MSAHQRDSRTPDASSPEVEVVRAVKQEEVEWREWHFFIACRIPTYPFTEVPVALETQPTIRIRSDHADSEFLSCILSNDTDRVHLHPSHLGS